MLVMAVQRHKPMPTEYRISARTLRTVWDAMVESVRTFADDRKVLFRGRKLGNEAYVNVAVWHFAEMPIEAQEAVLRQYLPRLEEHLAPPGVIDSTKTLPPGHVLPALDPSTGKATRPTPKRKGAAG